MLITFNKIQKAKVVAPKEVAPQESSKNNDLNALEDFLN